MPNVNTDSNLINDLNDSLTFFNSHRINRTLDYEERDKRIKRVKNRQLIKISVDKNNDDVADDIEEEYVKPKTYINNKTNVDIYINKPPNNQAQITNLKYNIPKFQNMSNKTANKKLIKPSSYINCSTNRSKPEHKISNKKGIKIDSGIQARPNFSTICASPLDNKIVKIHDNNMSVNFKGAKLGNKIKDSIYSKIIQEHKTMNYQETYNLKKQKENKCVINKTANNNLLKRIHKIRLNSSTIETKNNTNNSNITKRLHKISGFNCIKKLNNLTLDNSNNVTYLNVPYTFREKTNINMTQNDANKLIPSVKKECLKLHMEKSVNTSPTDSSVLTYKSINQIREQTIKFCQSLKISYNISSMNDLKFSCEKGRIKFEVKVNKMKEMPKLNVVKIRKCRGDLMEFKNLIKELIVNVI